MNRGLQLVNLGQLQTQPKQQMNNSLQSTSQTNKSQTKFQSTLQDSIKRSRQQEINRSRSQQETARQQQTRERINQQKDQQRIEDSRQQKTNQARNQQADSLEEFDQQDWEKLKKKLKRGEELTEKEVEQLLAFMQNLSTQLQDKLQLLSGEEKESLKSLQGITEQIEQQLQGVFKNQKTGKHLTPDKLVKLLNRQTNIKQKSTLIDLKSLQNNLKKMLQQLDKSKLQLADKHTEVKQLLDKLNGRLSTTKVANDLVKKLKNKQALEQKAMAKGKLARLNQSQQAESRQASEVQQSTKEASNDQKSLQLSQLLDHKQNKNASKIDALNLVTSKQEESAGAKIKINQNLSTNLQLGTSGDSNLKNIQSLQNSLQTANSKGTSFNSVLQQVGEKMDFMAAKRGKKVTLQLEPKSLGKLQMKIGVENGTVSAKVVAESGQVKEMLDGNLAKLKQALAEKNIHIDQFEVAVDEEGRGLAGQEFGDSRQQQFAFNQNNSQQTQEEMDLTLEDIEVEQVESVDEEQLTTDDSVDYVV